jgi:hypothetical protein
LGPASEIDDFCGIPAEIPHGGIDLGQRNLHSLSVATGMEGSRPRDKCRMQNGKAHVIHMRVY